ncbi:MAG: hypothetical protein RL685_4497 [Pseudomonadota bacterium]|jgi:hypothetical protein
MRRLDRMPSPAAHPFGARSGRSRWRRVVTSSCRAALLGVALLQAPPLLAQEPPRGHAPRLASLGKAARPAQARGAAAVELAAGACRLGRWAAAVDLMRVVSRRERNADDWLCLARAQRHTGEWVAALDSYDELAESAGKNARARSARQLGAAEREELEGQLAWLQIVPSAPIPDDAQLTFDGDVLASSLLGVAFPVSPGAHEIALEVEGGVQKFVRLRFEQGERRRVQFALPADDSDPSAVAGRRSAGRAARASNANAVWSRRALVAGGIASGGGFGLMLLSGVAGPARKGVFTTGASGLFLGGLSLITGALLRAGSTAEPAAEPAPLRPQRLQLQPWVGQNVAGVSGKF